MMNNAPLQSEPLNGSSILSSRLRDENNKTFVVIGYSLITELSFDTKSCEEYFYNQTRLR